MGSSRLLRDTVWVLVVGGTAGTLVGVGVKAATVRIRPGTVGVRQGVWSTAGALGSRDLAQGLHLAPLGWSSVHLLDGRLQLARFGFRSEGATLPPLEIRTPDGNTCKVHVEVLYRLVPGNGHRLVAAGLKSAWSARVEARLEEALADAYSRVPSHELMQPEALQARTAATRLALDDELAPLHAKPVLVMVSGVWFSGPYESELRQKQLEGQAVRTDSALARRARVKAENALAAHTLQAEEHTLEWELDRDIASVQVRLEAQIAAEARRSTDEIASRKLEAEQAFRRLDAEGDLALARAKGRRTELLGRALAGSGGRAFIAHELASELRIERIELSASELESTVDLERWLAALLGTGGSASKR